MLKTAAFHAGPGQWGLFTSGPSFTPADSTRELATVHVAGLEPLLQFARVTITAAATRTPTKHVVVSAYPPFPREKIADAIQRLQPVCTPAALCMVVQDRTGWAKVTPLGGADPDSVAAAVAHTKITGGWDTLVSAMREASKIADIKIYPPFGASKADGHFAWHGSSVWGNDVIAFLERHCELALFIDARAVDRGVLLVASKQGEDRMNDGWSGYGMSLASMQEPS
ncbi:MAG TPA: hypothetical protein VJN18_10870 [Polyangiaceae bacterium]|nr:hypothetical protein [Polyangiaceae bacterium]